MRLLVYGAVLAVPLLSFCSELDTKAKVWGTVSLFGDVSAVVPNATVWFHRSDGQYIKATTNNTGTYEVLLDPTYDYSVTAGGSQLCEIHRPVFRPKPSSTIKFDFTTTVCGIIDGTVVEVPRSDLKANDDRLLYREYYRSSYDPKVPYWFFEQSIGLGPREEQWLVVAFGQRDGDQRIKYGPFVPRFSRIPLPVTISFDICTLQADSAVSDQRNRTLRVEGNVVVFDGTNDPPRKASCVLLDLHQTTPQPMPCQN